MLHERLHLRGAAPNGAGWIIFQQNALGREIGANGISAGEIARAAGRQAIGDGGFDGGAGVFVGGGAAEPGGGVGGEQPQQVGAGAELSAGGGVAGQGGSGQNVQFGDGGGGIHVVAKSFEEGGVNGGLGGG